MDLEEYLRWHYPTGKSSYNENNRVIDNVECRIEGDNILLLLPGYCITLSPYGWTGAVDCCG
jgi:hypothetical protein